MANGPAMFKNFSEGAVAAISDKPPTNPAVYQAARTNNGPPNKANGATNAPRIPLCSNQAACLAPNVLASYGIDLTNTPLPYTAAKEAIIAYLEIKKNFRRNLKAKNKNHAYY